MSKLANTVHGGQFQMAPKCTLIFYMSSFGFSEMSIQDPEPDKEYSKLY